MDTPTAAGKTRIVIADGELTVMRAVHWRWLLAITVLAAFLRLYGIGEWSLWIDEAHTFRDATMPLAGKGGFLESERTLYPLTFLMLRGLFALGLGQGEGAMRLPFALLGIATVPVVALAGARLVGAWPAVLAAGLLAIDPWHVFWSQNARGYVVVVLVAALVANRMFAYVRDDRWRDLMLMWGLIVLATASHTTGAVLAFGFFALVELRRRPLDRRRLLQLTVEFILLLAVVWWAVKFWSPFEGFLQSKDSPSVPHFLQTTGYYFRPTHLLLAAIGLWQLRHFGGRDRALLLGSLSLVPFATLLVVGATIVLVTARYAISLLPVVTWLAAFAGWHLANAVGRGGAALPVWSRRLAVAVVPLLPLGDHAMRLVDYYTLQHGHRARWREASQFVLERAAGKPVRVVTINNATGYYYLRPGQWTFQVPPAFVRNRVVPLTDWMAREGKDETRARVCEEGAKGHFAWHRREAAAAGAHFSVMVTMPELAEQDADHSIRNVIADECRLVLHLPCWVGPKDESIYVYEWKQP